MKKRFNDLTHDKRGIIGTNIMWTYFKSNLFTGDLNSDKRGVTQSRA